MQKIIALFFIFLVSFSYQTYFDEEISRKLASYSLASYCNSDKLIEWSCGFTCKRVAKLTYVHYELTDKNNSAILGYSQEDNAIVIAFRGTVPVSLNNIITDLNFIQVDYDRCKDCKVHGGFYTAYKGLKDEINQAFKELQQKFPNSKVFLTGHSLGGALATLFLPDIFEWNGKKQLDAFYTFGQPRVGNKETGAWFQDNQLFSVSKGRVTHNRDPVVSLGPTILNFYHFGFEAFYKSFDEKFQLCDDSEDSKCARGIIAALNLLDHLSYYKFNWTINQLLCQ